MGGGPPGAEKPIATLENSNFLLKLQMKLFCTHTYTHTHTNSFQIDAKNGNEKPLLLCM